MTVIYINNNNKNNNLFRIVYDQKNYSKVLKYNTVMDKKNDISCNNSIKDQLSGTFSKKD